MSTKNKPGYPRALPSFDEFRADYIDLRTQDKGDRDSLRIAYGMAFAYEILSTLTARDETEANKAAEEVNRISVLIHGRPIAPNAHKGVAIAQAGVRRCFSKRNKGKYAFMSKTEARRHCRKWIKRLRELKAEPTHDPLDNPTLPQPRRARLCLASQQPASRLPMMGGHEMNIATVTDSQLRADVEWRGSPAPEAPDDYWIDDLTGEYVAAETGERMPPEDARTIIAKERAKK